MDKQFAYKTVLIPKPDRFELEADCSLEDMLRKSKLYPLGQKAFVISACGQKSQTLGENMTIIFACEN